MKGLIHELSAEISTGLQILKLVNSSMSQHNNLTVCYSSMLIWKLTDFNCEFLFCFYL